MDGGMHSRRVAVIGGTGFIGSHLTERLVAEGADVLAVAHTRMHIGNLAAVAGAYRFALCDILDHAGIVGALREFRPEIVYHLAAENDAQETFTHMAGAISNNAVGTANVLEAASAAGAGVLVYADSCKAYGNGPVPYRRDQPDSPICSYAIGKAAGWRLCLLAAAKTGMAVANIRATFIYGPRQNPNLITYVRDCVLRGAPVRLMGGSQTRDLLYVDDAVRALIAAALHPAARGVAIPVGGGRELGVIRICEEIAAAMGRRVEIAADARAPRLTEIWRIYCDNHDAAELLGWSPEMSLEKGLRLALCEPVAAA